jgi:hypothetical protein
MSSMPTYDQLLGGLGQDWHVHDHALHVEPVKIVSVQAGRAINEQHVAYHLVLELPTGIYGGQGTYSLVAASGQAWPILFSPAAPSATGQARLQASFHCPVAFTTAV